MMKITKQNSNKNAVESICIKLIRYWSQCNLTLQVIENSWSIVITDNLVFKEFTIFSLKIIILISEFRRVVRMSQHFLYYFI